jgi:hypothetical protein
MLLCLGPELPREVVPDLQGPRADIVNYVLQQYPALPCSAPGQGGPHAHTPKESE